MTGNKLFDCTEMFRHACSFVDCAELCHDKEDHINFAKPEIVNSALACEVFLKAICFYYDIDLTPLFKQKKGHDLKALYDVLPQELKEQLKMQVSHGYRDMWINPFGLEYLADISDAFQQWRYSYESKTLYMPTWFLTSFRNELREICCQLLYKMAWNEYKGSKNG